MPMHTHIWSKGPPLAYMLRSHQVIAYRAMNTCIHSSILAGETATGPEDGRPEDAAQKALFATMQPTSKWKVLGTSTLDSRCLTLKQLQQHVRHPMLRCICPSAHILRRLCPSWQPMSVIELQEGSSEPESTLVLHDGVNGLGWAAEWEAKEEVRLIATCYQSTIQCQSNSGRSTRMFPIKINPVDVDHVGDAEVCEDSNDDEQAFLTIRLETVGREDSDSESSGDESEGGTVYIKRRRMRRDDSSDDDEAPVIIAEELRKRGGVRATRGGRKS